MTEKKEQILEAALHLFAQEGYAASSTSKIAKSAGVSEGLIFRHFGNKNGLLVELLKQTQETINQVFSPIFRETDPKKILLKTLNLPLSIEKKHYDYWRLQYKLRWEPAYTNSETFVPILTKFEEAFTSLNYENPKMEAILFNQLLNSIAIDILLNKFEKNYISFLKNKYKL
ncbi:TetR/AcrR family transcriptional regulator [Flavicella sediminum]|uniref:TetR/AcrR family transcriptional regulator n=1 Tax=Flavicella sediminum TaxID=2585141 RepID=UPI001121063B|nr:helix-turn-helix domain-containing protein [Flavicella sediminum]